MVTAARRPAARSISAVSGYMMATRFPRRSAKAAANLTASFVLAADTSCALVFGSSMMSAWVAKK